MASDVTYLFPQVCSPRHAVETLPDHLFPGLLQGTVKMNSQRFSVLRPPFASGDSVVSRTAFYFLNFGN